MNILMVCLGNICRSPMAQGVMEDLVRQHKLDWKIDSAGTNGLHDGEQPDPRAIKEMLKHGIDISNQRSRKISPDDFMKNDMICIMDSMNFITVRKMAPPYAQEKVFFLMDFSSFEPGMSVPDPYYDNSFPHSYELIYQACNGIINKFK
ncbi:MAG TPA: low molecular weight protein-tyrosine-phosphatase [Saprospiraceae bacterium]|nr:low molecular weight protein-tyrosine-phosphatase [Saprospiraceae bacterium]